MDNIKDRKIITDELVVEKTRQTMEQWFQLLDKKGAKKMKHSEIFSLVSSIEELQALGQWNQNLFTTTYEWDRGLKERGQKKNGFEISVSKTIEVPIHRLYNSWIDEKIRRAWLPGQEIIIRKASEDKSARIRWSDNETSLSIDFYSKGENKSLVVVQHLKIANAQKAREMKEYWGDVLNRLKSLLE